MLVMPSTHPIDRDRWNERESPGQLFRFLAIRDQQIVRQRTLDALVHLLLDLLAQSYVLGTLENRFVLLSRRKDSSGKVKVCFNPVANL